MQLFTKGALNWSFFLPFGVKQSKSALSTRLWLWVYILFPFWINAVFFKLSVCQRILCLQQWHLFRLCIQIFRYVFQFLLSAALLIDMTDTSYELLTTFQKPQDSLSIYNNFSLLVVFTIADEDGVSYTLAN